jgi:hypothetical protein
MKDDLYLGRWRLIPELCIYEMGDVPISGMYEISEEGGLITVLIRWRSADGSDQEVTFSGPADGSRQPSDAPGISEFSVSRISDTILDSSAYAEGKELLYARRSASRDGRLLSTVQAARSGDGVHRNFQVYRRDDA